MKLILVTAFYVSINQDLVISFSEELNYKTTKFVFCLVYQATYNSASQQLLQSPTSSWQPCLAHFVTLLQSPTTNWQPCLAHVVKLLQSPTSSKQPCIVHFEKLLQSPTSRWQPCLVYFVKLLQSSTTSWQPCLAHFVKLLQSFNKQHLFCSLHQIVRTCKNLSLTEINIQKNHHCNGKVTTIKEPVSHLETN